MIITRVLYDFLHQLGPLFIFILCLSESFINIKLYSESIIFISRCIIGCIVFLSLYGIYGLITKTQFINIFGFRWTYFAMFSYSIYSIFSYIYLLEKTHNETFTLNYLIQSLSVGGYIYEIPRFFTNGTLSFMIRGNLNMQIISIIYLSYILIKGKPTLNKFIIISVFLYITYLLFGITNYQIYMQNPILHRIPTLIMFFSLISGIKNHDISAEISKV